MPELADLFRTPEPVSATDPFDVGEETFESSLPPKPAKVSPVTKTEIAPQSHSDQFFYHSQKTSMRSKGRARDDSSDDAPDMLSSDEEVGGVYSAFEPSLFKEAPPSSSVSASASEILFEDLTEKTRLLKIAAKQAEIYKKRCAALSAELASAKKRDRVTAEIDAAPVSDGEAEAPKKKRSPPSAAAANTQPAPSVVPVKTKKGSKKKAVREPGSNSDDDVPAPAPKVRPLTAGCRQFEQLHSILCAYKDDSNPMTVPGSPELPFELCAELCRDEAAAITSWSAAEKARFHPAIVSALHLVYKNKKPEWFQSKFLSSFEQTAEYWRQVLTRRSEIWDAAAKRGAAVLAASAIATITLKERIRQKIKQRKEGKIAALKVSTASASKSATKNTPVATSVPNNESPSSDSDSATPTVVDLSVSPGDPTSTNVSAPASAPAAKLAPAPDSYTKPEIKKFAKIAASIRDVDERQGFAPATIDFIDTEFSDATGRLAKASKSRDLWKQKRVDAACSMAAKIMEDR